MKSFWSHVVVAAVGFGIVVPAQADEFKAIKPDLGRGAVLLGKYANVASAKAGLHKALEELAKYFDGRPKVLSAMGSKDGKELHATFAASKGKDKFLGLALVGVHEKEATVGIVYDKDFLFGITGRNLMETLQKHVPGALGKAALREQRLPDGTGSIKVPDGWVVTATKGMVSAEGPHGNVDLGLWMQVWTPQAAQNPLGLRPPLVAPYRDPFTAFRDVNTQSYALLGVRLSNFRLLKKMDTPALVPGGQAAYLHYEVQVSGAGKPAKIQGLAQVYMNPLGDGTWFYYASSVASPADKFNDNAPVLVEIWKSWRVDDWVMRDRLAKAQKSLDEAFRLIQGANANRQRVMARAVDDWVEYIRGTNLVHDRRDDRLHEVNFTIADRLVENLNRREGYERYAIIPLKDLNNP